jgi:hypothetical protein
MMLLPWGSALKVAAIFAHVNSHVGMCLLSSPWLRFLKISLKDSQNNRVFCDPLKWWKEHQSVYPILASLARIYLALQGTSAPSERIFSMAARLISDKRASLNPELAGKLLFVSQNWEWWKNELNCDELALKDEE